MHREMGRDIEDIEIEILDRENRERSTHRQKGVDQVGLDAGQRLPLNQDGEGLVFLRGHQTTEPRLLGELRRGIRREVHLRAHTQTTGRVYFVVYASICARGYRYCLKVECTCRFNLREYISEINIPPPTIRLAAVYRARSVLTSSVLVSNLRR